MSIDRFSNYIPIVSTITNVKKLIDNAKIKDNRINEVSALLKSTQPQEVSQNLGDIKARKLSKGEILYSVIATFPFLGNLAVAIYDLGKHLSNRSNKSPVDNSRLEVEHLEVDNQKEKAREEINGKLIQLKAHFPEIQIIINELVNEKLKDADVNTYEKTLKYLNQCIPERFSSLDRRITIDALIRLGLTEEHLKNNENIQKELAEKFFSFDSEKKVTGFGSGIYEPLTDLGVMKQKLEEFFKVRSEFVKKYPL